MERSATTPFDLGAASYDAAFSDRLAARWLRDMVRRRIAPLAGAGDTVLEIGCGTGVDAWWLAGRGCRVIATDASAAMLGIARAKPAAAEVAARIRWEAFDAARPGLADELEVAAHPLRLVLSNFGALNCVRDLAPLLAWLRPRLGADAHVAITLMGRFCLWESAWFAARGRWAQMRRRWSGASRFGGGDSAIDVWYHSPRAVLRMAPGFERAGLYGIGALLPTSEGYGLCERWPRLFGALARADDRLAPLLHAVADHYLLILRPRA